MIFIINSEDDQNRTGVALSPDMSAKIVCVTFFN